MPTETYKINPDGSTTITSPEGIQTTYSPSGQVVSSKTPAQVQIESQITQAGGTMTPQATEQLQLGLQQQTREALAGQQPQPFQVTVPEGTVTATGGITPNVLAGATGSVIPQGYMMNELNQIVPAPQTFVTQEGKEFTATPIGTSGRTGYWMAETEYLWQTPYGQIRAEPRFVQKEIERQMFVTALGEQIKEQQWIQQQKEAYIQYQASQPLNKIYYSLTHPWEGILTPMASGILAVTGQKPFIEGVREIPQNYQNWIRAQIEYPETKLQFATEDIFFGVTTVLGFKFLPIAQTAIGNIASWSIAKSATTGAMIGLGAGIETISTAEAYKGYQEKSATRLGIGLAGIVGGALLIKSGWTGLRGAFLADYPSYKPPEVPTFTIEGVKQQIVVDEQARAAKAVSDVYGKMEISNKLGFKEEIEFKFSPETYAKATEKGGVFFLSEAEKVQIKQPLEGMNWLKAYLKGEPTWQWEEIAIKDLTKGLGITTTKGLEFKFEYATKRYDFEKQGWSDITGGVAKGKIITEWHGKPETVVWKDIFGVGETSKELVPEIGLFTPKGLEFGKTDISYISSKGPLITGEITGGSANQILAQQQKFTDIVTAPAKQTIKDVLSSLAKTFFKTPEYQPSTFAGPVVFPTQTTKTKQYQIPQPSIKTVQIKKQQDIFSVPTFKPFAGLINIEKQKNIFIQLPAITPVQIQTQRQTQELITKQMTTQITTPVMQPPIPQITLIPKITLIPPLTGSLPEGFVPRRSKRYFRSRQPRAYLPSMGAVLMGIKGSMPKTFRGMFTGLEMRPLVSRGGRKVSKKRRKR